MGEQDTWWAVLLEGFLGNVLSSLFTVAVAVVAVRYENRRHRDAAHQAMVREQAAVRRDLERERARQALEISYRAAEQLTAALLEARRRLGALADETVPASQLARRVQVRAAVDDLTMAAYLHAPVIDRPALAALADDAAAVAAAFRAAHDAREERLRAFEHLAPHEESADYARDGVSGHLRDDLAGWLLEVTRQLTAHRLDRDETLAMPPRPDFALPAAPR